MSRADGAHNPDGGLGSLSLTPICSGVHMAHVHEAGIGGIQGTPAHHVRCKIRKVMIYAVVKHVPQGQSDHR